MDSNFRADHIEDFLVTVRDGQWFGWSDSKNKVYANLIVHDGGSKPTEQECIDGLANLQSAFDTEKTNTENKIASGKAKLKELGLDDDELKQILGI